MASAGGETNAAAVQKNPGAPGSQFAFPVPNLTDETYPAAPGEVRTRMPSGTFPQELRIGRVDLSSTILPT